MKMPRPSSEERGIFVSKSVLSDSPSDTHGRVGPLMPLDGPESHAPGLTPRLHPSLSTLSR